MSDPIHPEALQYFDRKPWVWRDPSHAEHYRTCSWCGSINPEDLAAEPNWTASWADRKYGWPHKFYVDVVNREPERLFVVGMASRDPRPEEEGWIKWDDLDEEQRKVVDDWNGIVVRSKATAEEHPAAVMLATRQTHHAKFYSVHLADPNITPEVRNTIEERSGLRFAFREGRVTWQAA